jgi:hypothetical protein
MGVSDAASREDPILAASALFSPRRFIRRDALALRASAALRVGIGPQVSLYGRRKRYPSELRLNLLSNSVAGWDAKRKPRKNLAQPVDSNPDVIRARNHLAVAQADADKFVEKRLPAGHCSHRVVRQENGCRRDTLWQTCERRAGRA